MHRACLVPLLVFLAGCNTFHKDHAAPIAADLAVTHVDVVDVVSTAFCPTRQCWWRGIASLKSRPQHGSAFR